MANELQLNRVNRFWGGMVVGERDTRPGVCANIEELDIFKNLNYIEPTTIFRNITTDNDEFMAARKVLGYTKDNNNTMWALSRDATGTPLAQIWRKVSAGNDDPLGWGDQDIDDAIFTSGRNANDFSPVAWHEWTSGADYLYYVTGTTQLVSLGDLTTVTESTTDSASDTMTLSGLGQNDDRVPMIRIQGRLYIGHGRFIAKISRTGVFTEKAFTLPSGWEAVSFAELGDELAILCRSTDAGSNFSSIFYWDRLSTEGFNDKVSIPMGGPQIIINHTEKLRVFCAKNGILRIYEVNGKLPTKTHQLENVSSDTNTVPVIPDQTKFIKDNIIYFGLNKSDKPGLYALGQVEPGRPLALVLAKRMDTTDYSNHTVHAALDSGPNLYASFDDNGTIKHMKVEDNNVTFTVRSSNAVYESIWIDLGSPETNKDWPGFFITTKGLANANLKIKVDARVDNASSYDSNSAYDDSNNDALDDANDQIINNGTANTHWFREWTSVNGKAIQFRLRFTSSTTTRPILFSVGLLSRENNLL